MRNATATADGLRLGDGKSTLRRSVWNQGRCGLERRDDSRIHRTTSAFFLATSITENFRSQIGTAQWLEPDGKAQGRH